jgi:polar amino acid transport system substrate-binding protein
MGRFLAVVFALLAASPSFAQDATPEQKAQLAPTGTLRAAVIKIPFLAKQHTDGTLRGVAPDLAAELARVLGVPYQAATFDSPNAGIKVLREGGADITFLAPTPERLGLIDFAPAFMEMEVTLIVPGASTIRTLADADQSGRRIVVYEKTANDEMVRKSLTKATILRVPIFGYKKAFEMIRAGEADGFVDLRDQLMNYVAELPDARIVPGHYGRNALAIGYAKERPAAAAFIKEFTAAAIKSGFVAKSIERAGVRGAVAPGS